MKLIAKDVNTNFSDDVLDKVIELSEGDMRSAVTTLQCSHNLIGSDGEVTVEDVEEMSEKVPESVILPLMTSIKSGAFGNMEKAVEDVVSEGFSAMEILKTLSNAVIKDEELDDVSKAQISVKIGQVNKTLIDGADEMLQILDIAALCLRCFSSCQ